MIDTGVEVPRPAEPYKIRDDGVKLYLYRSPNNVFMIQHPTGEVYSEARDPESATYTYTESDEPIPTPETDLTINDTLEILNEFGVDTSD